MKPELYVAMVDLKYSITGVGTTEAEALSVLGKAVRTYFASFGERPPTDWQEYYGVHVQRLEAEHAYFDDGRAGEAPLKKTRR